MYMYSVSKQIKKKEYTKEIFKRHFKREEWGMCSSSYVYIVLTLINTKRHTHTVMDINCFFFLPLSYQLLFFMS